MGEEGAAATTSWAECLLDQTSSWTVPVCLVVSCWVYIMPVINKILKTGNPPKKIECEPTATPLPPISFGAFDGKTP